jgi:hypothetical protein
MIWWDGRGNPELAGSPRPEPRINSAISFGRGSTRGPTARETLMDSNQTDKGRVDGQNESSILLKTQSCTILRENSARQLKFCRKRKKGDGSRHLRARCSPTNDGDCFLALCEDNLNFDRAFLNVEDGILGLTLGEDNGDPAICLGEKRPRVKSDFDIFTTPSHPREVMGYHYVKPTPRRQVCTQSLMPPRSHAARFEGIQKKKLQGSTLDLPYRSPRNDKMNMMTTINPIR